MYIGAVSFFDFRNILWYIFVYFLATESETSNHRTIEISDSS